MADNHPRIFAISELREEDPELEEFQEFLEVVGELATPAREIVSLMISAFASRQQAYLSQKGKICPKRLDRIMDDLISLIKLRQRFQDRDLEREANRKELGTYGE